MRREAIRPRARLIRMFENALAIYFLIVYTLLCHSAMMIGSRAIHLCESCQGRKAAALSGRLDVLRGCPV